MENYNINSKKWQKFIHLHDGLNMSKHVKDLLYSNPKIFKSYCNGVGSRKGFIARIFYHIIPDTIYFLNIRDVANVHDVSYTLPKTFNTLNEALKYKKEKDQEFLSNLENRIVRRGGMFMKARLMRAHTYYFVLASLGDDSFLADKIIKNNNI